MHQGEGEKFFEGLLPFPVVNCRKLPAEFLLVDALREGDDPEKITGFGAKISEHQRRRERQLNDGYGDLVVVRQERGCTMPVPLLSHPIGVPIIVTGEGCE